jgi:hypothetical protein
MRGALQLRWIRGHTVVCGGGTKGSSLAAELLQERGSKIVLIDSVESSDIQSLRRQGVIVCIGDGTNPSTMQQVGLARASRLVCITGDDRTNIGIALAVADSMPQERRTDPIEIFVHVAEVARRNILQRSQLLDLKNDSRHRIRLFNCHANRARLALKENPLEWDERRGLCDEVHLVLGMLGQLEKAVIVHAAQIGQFRNGSRVNVHLVSVRAKSDEAVLLKEYPGFRMCANLVSIQIEEADDFVDAIAQESMSWSRESLVTFLSGGSAESALADALLLGERLKNCLTLRVLLDAPSNSGIRNLVAKNKQLASWVHFLPELKKSVGRDAVFQESLDIVAKNIHQTWKRQTDQKIRKAELEGYLEEAAGHRAKETYREWDDLTEEQKDGNRLAADHIPVKIRAVDLDPNAKESLCTAWATLDAHQIDMLSRMEHERWAAPLWMAGWTAGDRKDELKIHPNLVPYDDLDEGVQGYDVTQVKMAAAHYSNIN